MKKAVVALFAIVAGVQIYASAVGGTSAINNFASITEKRVAALQDNR